MNLRFWKSTPTKDDQPDWSQGENPISGFVEFQPKREETLGQMMQEVLDRLDRIEKLIMEKKND
jgi:hypothetical protein